jgi:hypothetical protein
VVVVGLLHDGRRRIVLRVCACMSWQMLNACAVSVTGAGGDGELVAEVA